MIASLWLVTLGLVGQVPPPSAPAAAREAVRDAARTLVDREAEALEALAAKLDGSGQRDQAREVRATIETPSKGGPIWFQPLPEVVPATKVTLPAEARKIRKESASRLFTLARKAGTPPIARFGLADSLLRKVLERDPDHADARRLLGFLPYKGGWATPHAVELLEKKGHVLHPKYGWVPADWVAHLDRGELPGELDSRRRPRAWLPEDEANALRSTPERPWFIETAPHFQIQADVPLAEAVEFGRRLEAFEEMFFSEFGDLIGRNLPLAHRFSNPTQQPVATTKKFQVRYFKEKSEYVAFFRDKFGRDETISLGYYMPPSEARAFGELKGRKVDPCSFFYKDEKNPIAAEATLYHESSHQLLFESAGKSEVDKARSNYWIWEGLGTYFETVRHQEDGRLVVGEPIGPRFAQARQNILTEGRFVPIADFAAMDKAAFGDEKDGAVYRNYAEAMAWTLFLLHGEGGRYREAFLDLAADAYRGRVRPDSLEDRLDVPFKTLDEQFLKYLKQTTP